MAIILFIIGILLLIFLYRFLTTLFLQLRTAKTIENNLAHTKQLYCTLGSVDKIKDFQDKLFELIDNLLDINKTIKVAVSFKKINIHCFLTDEEIEFLEKYFKYEKS